MIVAICFHYARNAKTELTSESICKGYTVLQMKAIEKILCSTVFSDVILRFSNPSLIHSLINF